MQHAHALGAAGTSKLVETSCQDMQEGVQSLLDDDALYRSFATKVNPFGDGHACDRIVSYLREHL